MAAQAKTRDPQTKGKTIVTAGALAILVALGLEEWAPSLSPGKVTFIVQTIVLGVALTGSSARDWIHTIRTRKPSREPGFWMTQLAKLG